LFAKSDKGKLLRKGRTQSHRPKACTVWPR